ncbi:hypothetical protein QBC43DRAFT_321337 [Cladorrhinum sp. PSN259]|nr:hypothetical protein QBC43DRAFT_321337 [Cladorrhinum sp. PSN259]
MSYISVSSSCDRPMIPFWHCLLAHEVRIFGVVGGFCQVDFLSSILLVAFEVPSSYSLTAFIFCATTPRSHSWLLLTQPFICFVTGVEIAWFP